VSSLPLLVERLDSISDKTSINSDRGW